MSGFRPVLHHSLPRWPVVAGAGAAVVLGVAAWQMVRPGVAPLPPASPAPMVATQPPPAPLPSPEPPRFDLVRIAPDGTAVIAGHAPPGAEIAVRANGIEIGRTTADADGNFVLIPAGPLPQGALDLGVSAHLADGTDLAGAAPVRVTVAARSVPTPVATALPSPTPPPAADRAVVESGQSLWAIARQRYGSGTRYPLIYDANRNQVHDPNRIYPGQVLGLPPQPAPGAGSSPASISDSSSR